MLTFFLHLKRWQHLEQATEKGNVVARVRKDESMWEDVTTMQAKAVVCPGFVAEAETGMLVDTGEGKLRFKDDAM